MVLPVNASADVIILTFHNRTHHDRDAVQSLSALMFTIWRATISPGTQAHYEGAGIITPGLLADGFAVAPVSSGVFW